MAPPPNLGPRTKARPSVESALEDALTAYAVVMRRLKSEMDKTGALNLPLLKELNKATDSFTKLARASVHIDQATDPGSLSDAELEALGPEALRLLAGEDVQVED